MRKNWQLTGRITCLRFDMAFCFYTFHGNWYHLVSQVTQHDLPRGVLQKKHWSGTSSKKGASADGESPGKVRWIFQLYRYADMNPHQPRGAIPPFYFYSFESSSVVFWERRFSVVLVGIFQKLPFGRFSSDPCDQLLLIDAWKKWNKQKIVMNFMAHSHCSKRSPAITNPKQRIKLKPPFQETPWLGGLQAPKPFCKKFDILLEANKYFPSLKLTVRP